jgi:hypothetical protein
MPLASSDTSSGWLGQASNCWPSGKILPMKNGAVAGAVMVCFEKW